MSVSSTEQRLLDALAQRKACDFSAGSEEDLIQNSSNVTVHTLWSRDSESIAV